MSASGVLTNHSEELANVLVRMANGKTTKLHRLEDTQITEELAESVHRNVLVVGSIIGLNVKTLWPLPSLLLVLLVEIQDDLKETTSPHVAVLFYPLVISNAVGAVAMYNKCTILHLQFLLTALPLFRPLLKVRNVAFRLIHRVEDDREVSAILFNFMHASTAKALCPL